MGYVSMRLSKNVEFEDLEKCNNCHNEFNGEHNTLIIGNSRVVLVFCSIFCMRNYFS